MQQEALKPTNLFVQKQFPVLPSSFLFPLFCEEHKENVSKPEFAPTWPVPGCELLWCGLCVSLFVSEGEDDVLK